MYAKPTNNAPERKYVQLSDNTENFKSQLEVIWQKARLRKHGQGAFVLQHFVYEQLPSVAEYMRECQIEGGAATTRYATVSQARLPEDAPTSVPDIAHFQQLQFIAARPQTWRLHSINSKPNIGSSELACMTLPCPYFFMYPIYGLYWSYLPTVCDPVSRTTRPGNAGSGSRHAI
ncbi:hypothetical protein GQ600_16565 [Phytophthora cactorum]|nr:hypothetical protein GQ600_16565 [Phytophthora cactorum]